VSLAGTAECVRRLRDKPGAIKVPDAIQLACAGEAGVDLFATNDRRLQGKRVEGVQFIVALNQVPIRPDLSF